jgi:metaxin
MNLTSNFHLITKKAYIHTQSQSYLVREVSSYELRAASDAELRKYPSAVDSNGRYADAERAFSALDNLLKRRKAFAAARGQTQSQLPTFLEASLFSYLFLLLEFPFDKWADVRLVETLKKFPGLVEEEQRMKKEVFGGIERPEIYDLVLEQLS